MAHLEEEMTRRITKERDPVKPQYKKPVQYSKLHMEVARANGLKDPAELTAAVLESAIAKQRAEFRAQCAAHGEKVMPDTVLQDKLKAARQRLKNL